MNISVCAPLRRAEKKGEATKLEKDGKGALEAQLCSLRLGRASLVTKKHRTQEACQNTEPRGWRKEETSQVPEPEVGCKGVHGSKRG